MLRIGLIGLGYWGPHYARIVAELPDAELAWACDVSASAIALVQARFPFIKTTRNAAEVIAADDLDAIVVATPTSTHYALTRDVLDAGKHVLCEKPLATTTAECDDLIAAAEAAGRILCVGHTFIFNPAVRAMRELIAQGEVGRVLYCHASRTALGPIRQDVNVLWDLAPHDLSILMFLMGRAPDGVSATGQAFLRPDVEDVAFVHLGFEDGAIAALHLSWLDPYKVRRVTVVGDQRMLVFDDVSVDEKLRIFDRGASYEAVSEAARGAEYGEFKALIRDGDVITPRLSTAEPLKVQVAHFVECCLEDRTPETDARAGRAVVAVLEAATRSLRGNGAGVGLRPAVGTGL